MRHERRIIFITHADVVIDPDVPVPRWPLSKTGRARHHAFNAHPLAATVTAVYASEEQKAMDGGEILASHLGLPLNIRAGLHENDRSATGYLPPDAFWPVVARFFAEPDSSINGWERAIDAQSRIVGAISALAGQDDSNGSIAIVSHGGVGALMMAHCLKAPIAMAHGAKVANGGACFVFILPGWRLVSGWHNISA